MDKTTQLLKALTDVNGIAGYEMEVKALMKSYLTPVSDEIIEDNLGGVFGKKTTSSGSKTLMIAGHLDEVGFIVTKIDDNGFLKFTPVGGWWSQVMLSQKVTLTTFDGKKIRGVIGSKPPHVLKPEERTKAVDIKEMFIDIGVADKAAAEAAGVELGNMITPYSEFETLTDDNYLCAKALDNRYGCALAIDVLNNLKDETVDVNVVAGGNVQEEVGLRGAKVAAHKIKPDLAIAVDVGIPYDTPGMSGQTSDTSLGKGPIAIMLDASHIGHYGLRKIIKRVAEKHNIPVQWDVTTGGGTDAGNIHLANDGIPTVAVGVALRYMHSNISVLHKEDYENSVQLVTEIVRELNDTVIEELVW